MINRTERKVRKPMTFGLVLLAITLGLDVFAGGVSLGVGRLERDRWTRTALIFAFFTLVMTGLGVVLGRLLGERFGDIASYVAGVGLIGVGIWAMVKAVQGHDDSYRAPKNIAQLESHHRDRRRSSVSISWPSASPWPLLKRR